jgi:hypothetical protein
MILECAKMLWVNKNCVRKQDMDVYCTVHVVSNLFFSIWRGHHVFEKPGYLNKWNPQGFSSLLTRTWHSFFTILLSYKSSIRLKLSSAHYLILFITKIAFERFLFVPVIKNQNGGLHYTLPAAVWFGWRENWHMRDIAPAASLKYQM